MSDADYALVEKVWKSQIRKVVHLIMTAAYKKDRTVEWFDGYLPCMKWKADDVAFFVVEEPLQLQGKKKLYDGLYQKVRNVARGKSWSGNLPERLMERKPNGTLFFEKCYMGDYSQITLAAKKVVLPLLQHFGWVKLFTYTLPPPSNKPQEWIKRISGVRWSEVAPRELKAAWSTLASEHGINQRREFEKHWLE